MLGLFVPELGLGAYLTKWTTPQALEAGAMSGAFFETWVIGEIIKSYYNAGKRPPLYYYRDKDHQEIDLIIHENNTLYPIEIKKGSNPGKDAVRHFEVLGHTGLAVGEGSVICLSGELLPVDKKIGTFRLGLFDYNDDRRRAEWRGWFERLHFRSASRESGCY